MPWFELILFQEEIEKGESEIVSPLQEHVNTVSSDKAAESENKQIGFRFSMQSSTSDTKEVCDESEASALYPCDVYVG